MKVLMASRYVQPNGKFFNSNVCRQARALETAGVNVEILTWPKNDLWTGPLPEKSDESAVPPLSFDSNGIVYHVINPSSAWDERPLNEKAWIEAVAYGEQVLKALRPDIVHLQHWFGLWWILESAQKLGIPTVYTNHDWGIACLRTVLVMGDDSLCDGTVSTDKCAKCIWEGRNPLGKANETVADSAIGRLLIESAFQSPLKSMLERHGAVRLPIRTRVDLNLDRAKKALRGLQAMFTPSEFGRDFFKRLGVPADIIRIKPWYHDPIQTRKTIGPADPFTVTYIGRVSAEKGVHQIFEALAKSKLSESIRLRVAGANSSAYCRDLESKYPSKVGMHRVEWLGWSDVEPLFLSTDVAIIPSVWIDNTPLSLVESLSYRVPVIATKVPPIQELVVEGENGYLADYLSIDSLAAAIERAVQDKNLIRGGMMHFPRVDTCVEYTQTVKDAYESIYSSSGQSR